MLLRLTRVRCNVDHLPGARVSVLTWLVWFATLSKSGRKMVEHMSR